MLRWIWIAPIVLLAGCSKSEVATTPGTKAAAGYAQPGAAQAGTAQAATLPPATPAPANPLPADPSEPVAQPEPPAAPVRAGVMIPGGTAIHVRMDESVDTNRNRPGDRFSATLSQPVQSGGRMLIPAGTRFSGHVTTAADSGRMTGRARLGVVLDSFRLNGREYRIHTTSVDRVSESHKKRNSWLVGGGAGLGAALGAIAGGGKGALIGAGAGAGAGTAGAAITGKKDVAIGAETPLRFTLRSPVEM